MIETLIAGDGKPSPEDPKPNPKPPTKLEIYWKILVDYYLEHGTT